MASLPAVRAGGCPRALAAALSLALLLPSSRSPVATARRPLPPKAQPPAALAAGWRLPRARQLARWPASARQLPSAVAALRLGLRPPGFGRRWAGGRHRRSPAAGLQGIGLRAAPAAGRSPPLPSVSVQVVTWNRPALLLEALAQVYAQDYPGEVEVVVIDDSYESSEAGVLEFAEAAGLKVSYQFLAERRTIGEKRNMAAASTSADIICLWDDDDIFPSDRISRQVHSLLTAEGKDCSYATPKLFYAFARDQLNIGLYEMDTPHESALCFRRSWFEEGSGFKNCSWAEGMPLYQRKAWQTEGASASCTISKLDNFVQLPPSELPILYVKHPNSATGEIFTSSKVRCYDDPPLVDESLLSLARSLREARYPRLPMPVYSSVLQGVRSAVFGEIGKDVQRLRAAGDEERARGYWRELGGEEDAPPESFDELMASIEAMQRELLTG